MSSFGSSLNIGTSAILAAQRGLDITGQNIANSATPGYTRQRVDLESIGGPGVPAFWSRYDGTGEGVRVTGVTRMNDEFLEARARNAGAALSDVQEQAKTFDAVERTVGEPSTTGLQKKLSEFWNSWSQISNDPRALAPRNQTVEKAGAVANQLNLVSDSLTTQWNDTHAQLSANVEDVNTMARDVAKLNAAIRNNDIAKVPSNELLDQRDVLIGKISALTGATVRPAEMDAGTAFGSRAVDVVIGGKKLVDGTSANAVRASGPSAYPSDGTVPAPVGVEWADGSGSIGVTTGALSGQLKALNQTLPGYLAKFDGIAAQLAGTVNAQLAGAYTESGASGSAHPLLTGGGTVTAANIRVAENFQPKDLAVSVGNPTGTPPAFDGDNAMAMAAKLSAANGPDNAYNALVVELGVQAQSVNRNVEVNENVVKQAEDARDNVSGVSLNEEMTNLIKFQHSFGAAAKFIGVIDQTLDTLINMVR